MVLVRNMWRGSICHHIQRSPHKNVLPRDDSRIATRQQMDWSNCVGHSGISWHCRIFWNIIHSIHFRWAHQITAYSVSILWKHFIEDCDGSISPNVEEGVMPESPSFYFWFFAVKLPSLVLVCIKYIGQGNLPFTLMHSQNLVLLHGPYPLCPGGHQLLLLLFAHAWVSQVAHSEGEEHMQVYIFFFFFFFIVLFSGLDLPQLCWVPLLPWLWN